MNGNFFMKTLILFDMDYTMIIPNKKDKIYNFERVIHPKYTKTYRYFLKMRKLQPKNIGILSARPINCKQQMLKFFKIDNIITLDFNFKQEDLVNIQLFISNYILWKTRILNELAGECDMIIYFDDQYERFKELKHNIVVLAPL